MCKLMSNQLQKKIDNINLLIDEYTILRAKSLNNSTKQKYGFFITHLVKQKKDLQELIIEMKEEAELIL